MDATLTVLEKTVSDTAWGSVDKTALGNKLAAAYANGDVSESVIREVYAYVEPDAFGKDAEGKRVFHSSKAHFPHHEFVNGKAVLNRGGVNAARAAANGARSGGIPAGERAKVIAHLNRHNGAVGEANPKRVHKGAAVSAYATMLQMYERLRAWQYPQPHYLTNEIAIDLPDDYPTDMDATELAKALPQMFKSPGGKKHAAKKIISLMQPHKRYVEAYTGSGAVFWRKDPSPEEVLNDLRENLIDTFRYVRDTTDYQPLMRKQWVASKEMFLKLRDWKPETPVDKAYRYLWLSRASLMNNENDSYSPWLASQNVHPPLLQRLNKWHDRLQGVTLLQKDAQAVIQHYDDPYTFFYLDPPYPKGRLPDMYPGHEYTMTDLAKLFELCAQLRGKFLMSLNAKSLPREGLPKGLLVKKIAIWYPVLPTSHKNKTVGRTGALHMEVLVHNYPL